MDRKSAADRSTISSAVAPEVTGDWTGFDDCSGSGFGAARQLQPIVQQSTAKSKSDSLIGRGFRLERPPIVVVPRTRPHPNVGPWPRPEHSGTPLAGSFIRHRPEVAAEVESRR
ncbi:MAG: hypothetical protein MJE77_40805 [Proteobacteria bacterium]|nr:hypothetical protein [Pseudomonadota bacterium]